MKDQLAFSLFVTNVNRAIDFEGLIFKVIPLQSLDTVGKAAGS